MKERSYRVESGPRQKRLDPAPPNGTADAASQTCLAAAPPKRGPAREVAGLSKPHNITTLLSAAEIQAASEAIQPQFLQGLRVAAKWHGENGWALRTEQGRPSKIKEVAPRLAKTPSQAGENDHRRNGERRLAPVILRLWDGGSGIEVGATPRHSESKDDQEKTKRREITEWSNGSRFRLKWFLATLTRAEVGRAIILTLTYPSEFPAPEDHATYKNHLRVFYQGLCRHFPGCSGVWKLEFQQRGAAHFHLICLNLHGEEIDALRVWVETRWYKIAHNGDKHLGKAACNLERIKTAAGGMSYLVKYVSKGDQTMPGNFTGRYWASSGKRICHWPGRKKSN